MTWKKILKLSTEEAISDAKRYADEDDLEGERPSKTRLLKTLREHQKSLKALERRIKAHPNNIKRREKGMGFTHLSDEELKEYFDIQKSYYESSKKSLKFIGDALNADKIDRAKMSLLAFARRKKNYIQSISKYRITRN
jgi:hypothetical protein